MSSLSLQLQLQRDILRQRLAAHGQEHLLRFADVLDDASFTKLAEDISEVDFEQLSQIVALSLAPASSAQPSEPVPLPSASMLLSGDLSPGERSALFAVGLQHIAQSHVALIILAGGQGTRLGTEDPKGCYDIGLPSHSSLFQLQVARTLKLSALAGSGCVPVYIMTSPMTHAATVKFFEDNAFFGCDRRAPLRRAAGNHARVSPDSSAGSTSPFFNKVRPCSCLCPSIPAVLLIPPSFLIYQCKCLC